ncbi:carboxymuconolactone decarboxylase family protein [Mycolicibacterium sp. CH28]|uniref:carboxymuconolactone decarboxylase family protein n=1 Tax=Mycolicibacterium sp. CH28 TaxID=2512237 RepID=UPI0010812867|nr:carboxymuconolactone decarboxylase family protein [Mycolicibacterium sp. CH28]TGD87314.1 carboxymuconolactone decarboxylase family protein [Mycolicibacterium sp. CH28]
MTNPGPTMAYAEFNRSAVAVRDALLALGTAVDASGLDKTLTELMKLRASQINGCAFCVQYHLTVARRLAVPAEKLDLLTVWSETDLYSPRERAALAWAEALTRLDDDVARATALVALREEFTQTEILNLTTTVGTINQWNRIAIGLGLSPQLTASASTEAE